jgi:HSP20 family protein
MISKEMNMKNNLDIFRSALVNPWSEFTSLQRRMEKLFENMSNSNSLMSAKSDVDFLPACDVEEKENQYLITFDVPGIPKDQIKVEFTGDTLTVSGEHKQDHKEEKGKRKIFERTEGRFERSFTLPGMTNAEKIEAVCKDGVLKIYVPKSESSRTHRIPVVDNKGQNASINKPQEKRDSKPGETRAA